MENLKTNSGGLLMNSVFNEDCLVTMKRMPDNYIDGVITSPPYRTII